MKKLLKNFVFNAMLIFITSAFLNQNYVQAQESNKPSIAVKSVDPAHLTDCVRLELSKLDKYQVLDKYDMQDMASKDNKDTCLSVRCQVGLGKILTTDFMLTGSIYYVGNKTIVNLKLINVKEGKVSKTTTDEYIKADDQINLMVRLSLEKLCGITSNPEISRKLSMPDDFENAINNPEYPTLNNSGIRMGVTVVTGSVADRVMAPKNQGGYNGYPFMSSVAYQFETKYITQGRAQCLAEFVFALSGLDQGLVNPSFLFLNGIRSNKTGWEFAIGPQIGIIPTSKGFYKDNSWVRLNDISAEEKEYAKSNYTIYEKLDSRGTLNFTSGFVFAFGKTFKSGKLNIPVNVHIIPGKEGWRMGASFGFNTRNHKK